MSNEFAINKKNIKVLMTEVYKFLNDLWPPIMNNVFLKKENYYSLRFLVFEWKFVTTYGIVAISLRVPHFLQDLPEDIKNTYSLNFFKYNTKRYGNLTFTVWVLFNFYPKQKKSLSVHSLTIYASFISFHEGDSTNTLKKCRVQLGNFKYNKNKKEKLKQNLLTQ